MSESSTLTVATATKTPPRVAIEPLTTTEAVWHVVVLVGMGVVYLVMVIMARLSPLARVMTFVALATATVLTTMVLHSIAKSHRASALQALREAIASGSAPRIRAAIWRAQAAGVSAEEVAATQELREALSGKLQSALAGQDMERLGTAVRCAQAAASVSDESGAGALTAALATLQEPGDASPRGAAGARSSRGESGAGRGSEGSTAASGEVNSQRRRPTGLARPLVAGTATVLSAAVAAKRPSPRSSGEGREDVTATARGAATSVAGMAAEEAALADWVLCNFEESPIQDGHRKLRRRHSSTAAVSSTAGDMHSAVEVRRASAAGVSAEEINAASAVLEAVEARRPRTPTALRLPSAAGAGRTETGMGGGAGKRATLAGEIFRINEAKASRTC